MKKDMNGKLLSAEKKGNKFKKWKVICLSILGVLVIALVVLGVEIYQALDQPQTLFDSSGLKSGQSTPKQMIDIDEPSDMPVQESKSDEVTPFTDRNIVNILLAGIDNPAKFGGKGDAHTDALIVLAVNFGKRTVDMISLPRDTFTHVPGIKGIYKLNAAINCGGGKTEEGFSKMCEAAEWMLGGISVDYYCALDFETVIEIGDMIGGVDFNVDMDYAGESGTRYKKGQQHLDGTGIYDYMRVRKAATVDATDIGRMNRCRAIIMAMFKKVKSEGSLIQVVELLGTVKNGLYTNLNAQQMLALAYFGMNVNENSIGSYTMTGEIHSAAGWNFMFLDQKYRIELIEKIYGVKVSEQELVSREYADWLRRYGFTTVKYIYNADTLIKYVRESGEDKMTADQASEYDLLLAARALTQEKYQIASYSLSKDATDQMKQAQSELKEHVTALAKLINYKGTFSWKVDSDWTKDKAINSVTVDFR